MLVFTLYEWPKFTSSHDTGFWSHFTVLYSIWVILPKTWILHVQKVVNLTFQISKKSSFHLTSTPWGLEIQNMQAYAYPTILLQLKIVAYLTFEAQPCYGHNAIALLANIIKSNNIHCDLWLLSVLANI